MSWISSLQHLVNTWAFTEEEELWDLGKCYVSLRHLVDSPHRALEGFTYTCFGIIYEITQGQRGFFFFCSFICLKSSVLLHWYGLLCDTMSNCSHTIEMRPLCHSLVYCYGLWKKHYRGVPVKPSVSQRESRGSDSCTPAFRRKIKFL